MLILAVSLTFARFTVRITCSAANLPLWVGMKRAVSDSLTLVNHIISRATSTKYVTSFCANNNEKYFKVITI